jgi:Sap, sulfolipid-1-addressing protein
MGEAIGQVLAFAVVVAISPISIIGVVLMLGTPRARSNGPAFIAGWAVGLAVVGSILLLIEGGAEASEAGGPADWTHVLKLILGIALLFIALRQWRSRPAAGGVTKMPGWMRDVDHFTAGRSAALAVGLAAVNPKNLAMILGAATAIAQTGASAGSQAVALLVFVLIASLGTGLPVALYFAMGERSTAILDDLKLRMAHNSAAVMAAICLVIGAKLIGDAISGLSL